MAPTEYKIKDLISSKLKDGEKKEVEVEGIEQGKVLLVSTGGKTHAISAKCTHYGAPLKNGVLTKDGRLTCPWHGACFKVASGDVEDAPALDPLATFSIVEKDGGVYITGDEATIKANRRAAVFKCSPLRGTKPIVIVGGGSGATGVLHALRTHKSEAPVTVISSEPNLPIDRTKLSKAFVSDVDKLLLRPQEWYTEAGINTITAEVDAIDFKKKTVSTATGGSYEYSKLVLATGGTPRQLPIEGFKELGNIFVLRNVEHVKAIQSAIGEKGKKIVIIGSSFIGLEAANALTKENEVTVVGGEKVPLERVMGEEIGRAFRIMIEKTGVKFYMEASAAKATPSASNPHNVGAVHLKDGTILPADLVILGVGVAPATGYLKQSPGLTLEKDGSVKTNANFEVDGLADVYAIGDIATYPYHGPGGNGIPVRIEHWDVAQNAGRAVGVHIASPSTPAPKAFIPVFWSALGSQLRYCGNSMMGWDGLVVRGAPAEGKFAAFYAKGETVVATASMGMDPLMTKCAELMREGKMPSKSELDQGVDVLTIDL